ncbi:MAG: hypothetical protein HFE59_03540 [Clostridiales bacterium]|nr:hypothetical protein [Clostridiales bacterium]
MKRVPFCGSYRESAVVEADTDAFGEWVHEISGEKFLSSFERVLTLQR